MTARPFWDPVTGAAIAHLGLPILPGLPCPTCGGKRWRRAPAPWDEVLPGRPCPDCTDGVWTPPDSPVTIGVTSAEPGGSYGDWDVYFDHISYSLGSEDGDDNLVMHPIVLSSVIGEGTLRKLKVVEADADGHGAVVEMRPDGSLWFWPEGAFGEDAATDISSALPFLPGLKPGDTVYLLDGFTESVECPECEGSLNGGEPGYVYYGTPEPGSYPPCGACIDDRGIPSGRLSCPFPTDAPDHPCVLEAT